MMCKLWRTIQKLYIKPFSAIVLMWVIRQCLHIDTNPWFIHKNKIHPCSYMEVWAPQTFGIFTWKWKQTNFSSSNPEFSLQQSTTLKMVSEIL